MTFVILCDWPGSSNYHVEIVAGIEQYCKENNINLLQFSVGSWSSQDASDYFRYNLYELIALNEIDGIISLTSSIVSSDNEKKYIEYLHSITDSPIVHVSKEIKNEYCISFNNNIAFRELFKHLIEHHKYKKIGFITGNLNNPDAVERLEIYKESLNTYEIPFNDELICFGNWRPESGVEGFHTLQKYKPEAIVCSNDYIAIGAYKAALNEGVIVPDDLAITGYDNIPLDKYFELPFTTIKQPFKLMGERAVLKLHNILNKNIQDRNEILPTKLLIKESCGCWYDSVAIEDELSESESKILSDIEKAMNQAFKYFLQNPEYPLLSREWNGHIQKIIKYRISDRKVWSILISLFNFWNSKIFDLNLIKKLNQQITKIEKITNDNMHRSESYSIQESEFEMGQSHIFADSFSTKVISSLSLHGYSKELFDLFNSLSLKNVIIYIFDEEKNSQQNQGSILFCMLDGKIIDKSINQRFDLTKSFLPKSFKKYNNLSLLIEPLFEGDEHFGILAYDIKEWKSEKNEYIRRKLSGTIHALKTAKRIKDTNQKLEKEIELRKQSELKIQELLDELKDLSLNDQLTGLFNRRGFITVGEQQLKQYLRDDIDFLVLFCDMDGLKKINDTFGHKEGDTAIKAMAMVLNRSFRNADVIGRLGGDEFTLLLGAASTHNLEAISKRVKVNIEKINSELNKPYKIDFSYGVCSYSETGESDLSKMMEMADHELYIAKKMKKKKM